MKMITKSMTTKKTFRTMKTTVRKPRRTLITMKMPTTARKEKEKEKKKEKRRRREVEDTENDDHDGEYNEEDVKDNERK